jgi:hypothetical protein
MSAFIEPPRRRVGHDWGDSDEDDDLEAELEARHTDLYFGSGAGADEERIMAAYRGHMVSGKKVPTKEAIASLEVVKLEGLNDDSKPLPRFYTSSELFLVGFWSIHLFRSPVLS